MESEISAGLFLYFLVMDSKEDDRMEAQLNIVRVVGRQTSFRYREGGDNHENIS